MANAPLPAVSLPSTIGSREVSLWLVGRVVACGPGGSYALCMCLIRHVQSGNSAGLLPWLLLVVPWSEYFVTACQCSRSQADLCVKFSLLLSRIGSSSVLGSCQWMVFLSSARNVNGPSSPLVSVPEALPRFFCQKFCGVAGWQSLLQYAGSSALVSGLVTWKGLF